MAVESQDSGEGAPHTGEFLKKLTIWGAVGLSICLMGPSVAANIDPQGSAMVAGRAVPLSFAIATIGVLLVAYGIIRLCQAFNHAGSVYGFVGRIFGPRAGVVAGWSLIGTYACYVATSLLAVGIFLTSFIEAIGLWKAPPTWLPYLIGVLGFAIAVAVSLIEIRSLTRTILSIEVVTIVIIVIIAVAVVVKLITHTAPNGNTIDFSVFVPSKAVSASGLFLGVVFGFLAFAGFESSATLGEETKDPRRAIPRAIMGVAIFGGVWFVAITAIEVMGFGANAKGVQALAASGSIMGDLGTMYLAKWVGELVMLGTAIGVWAMIIACATGSSRILFSLSRDGVTPRALSVLSGRGEPVRATWAVCIGVLIAIAALGIAFRPKPYDMFFWFGTAGTLVILFVYLMTTVAALKYLFFSGQRKVARWEMIIPLAGIVVLIYVLWRNVYPYPAGAYAWLPPAAAVWIALGLLIIALRPRAASLAGQQLAAEEGLLSEASPVEVSSQVAE